MKNENPHRVGQDAEGAVGNCEQQSITASSHNLQSSQAAGAIAQNSDEIACRFLRLILPDRGHYVAMIAGVQRRRYNAFASTIDALWQIIKQADEAGDTAYHACASFREARFDLKGTPGSQRQFGRTKRNASGAKALWSDIDAGPGKPYPDWQTAVQAVASFCGTTGLPCPLCVLSGLGLHIYWPLTQTLDPTTWQQYAIGLKALYAKHGLQADPTRTADISSVLRTPGTHHRKYRERLVQCGALVGPYDIDQFRVLLSAAIEGRPKASTAKHPQFGAPPPYLAMRKVKCLTQSLCRSPAAYEPAYGALIARRCEQVRALRDSRGNISEPLWYSSLGVLAFTEDGGRLAHDWSSGYSRYSYVETQERFDRARALSGPSTCARFQSLRPEVCRRCRWSGKIKSPIVLGQLRVKRSGRC